RGLAGLHGAGGGVGIDRVALAAPAAGGPVGSVDLQDPLAVAAQEAGQAGAVAAGALHPPGLDLAERVGPGQQLGVAAAGGRRHGGAKPAAELVSGRGHVQVLVGVDADGDPWRLGVCHGGGCHPLDATGRVVAPAGRADSTATSLVATGSYQVTCARSVLLADVTTADGSPTGTRPVGPR